VNVANSFFPSRTITIYMGRMFLIRAFAVLFAIAIVLQTLDLLGQSDKVLAYPGNGSDELWRYVSLRFPQVIAFLLPFSILLGTLVTLATLNQNSEVVSLKAAGLSAHQVLAPLIVASMIVAAISFVFNDRIVSRATATLDQWERAEFGPIPDQRADQVNVWVRDGDNLIHAARVAGRGAATRLTDVTVYNRSGGTLQSVVTAVSATPVGTGWRLVGARQFDVARGADRPLGTIETARGVRPDQFALANVDGDGLSFRKLWAAIEDLKAAGRPTGALEATLWHKIANPLSAVLMPLLGAVAAFGLARSGRLFIRAVIGMALGFAYFVADNFGLAMGNLGAYPPLLAAWGPFFLFLLIGEAVLIQTEE
jgi:lipopolysaccharide export system permease protein